MPLYGPSADGIEPVDISNVLAAGLRDHPDEVAVVSTKNSWTWRQLDKACERYAAHLYAKGIRKGDRVASLMPNRDTLVVHYLGCLRAGFVAVPLNYRYMAPEIDHALSLVKPKIILAHVEREADLAASEEVAKLPLGVISYGEGEGDDSIEAMLEKEAPEVTQQKTEPGDPAAVFFTSGSTGKPKGVTHSFDTLGRMFATHVVGYEMTKDDVMLSASSMSHIGSFLHGIMSLAMGIKILLPRTFDADEALWLLRHHAPTIFLMLPSALFGVVRHPDAKREDFASIRLCISGGDKVPLELERAFDQLTGVPIEECYGMSEIGIATRTPPTGLNKPGSVGPANIGYALSIRDEDGNEVEPGIDGRLWVKSPINMIGYWNNPKATAKTIVDGWLDTGDVMSADGDGYLWFHGRKKQIIVHDASNISPQEVEETLVEHPAVLTAGVVGVHDLVHGENVWAYVTLSDEVDRPDTGELIEFSRERVGYKAPEVIIVLDEMPLNATGKVDRVTLKKWAAERHDAEVAG
ncbi:MAG: class I adenylate-forming enzyme family protein [Pseudomonadota bacterium]